MNKNIYVNTILKQRIIIKPEYINKNLNKNIEQILKKEVGDKCINEGYIKSDTINIIKRSAAQIISRNFSGDLAIDIIYSANVCKPVRGNIINCTITRINKLGLQGENFPLSIIIAKQYHNNKDIFKNLRVGQQIDILVIGTRYSLNDKVIEVVGKLTTDKDINKSIKQIKGEKKEEVFESKPLEEKQAESELESDIEQETFQEEETEEEEDIADTEKDIEEVDDDEEENESEPEDIDDEDTNEESIVDEEYDDEEEEEFE